MEAKLYTEEGIEICKILDLKTIRGIRNRVAAILTDMNKKGRYKISFVNGEQEFDQFIQIY